MPSPDPQGAPGDADDELDLPPLDGDGQGDEAEAPAPDFEEGEVQDAGDDPFDDAAAGDEVAPELEVEGEEHGWLADTADADTLDVGGDLAEWSEADDLLSDNEEPGEAEGDYDLDEEGGPSALDAGEEGPDADDEELREQDLPRLDADDEGEGSDDAFFDPLLGEGHDGVGHEREGRERPARAPRAWERVGSPVRVAPMRSIACAARGMLVGGRGLVRVDLEGACDPLPAAGLTGGEVTGVRHDGVNVVATTERGGVLVSRDGGGSFTAANGWRERVAATEAAAGIEVALGAGELWGRTAQGKLLFSADLGASWEHAPVDGFVLGLGVDERGHLVAVLAQLGRAELVRGLRASLETTRLALGVERRGVELRPGVRVSVAARGPAVALAVEGEGVYLARDGVRGLLVQGTAGAAALEFLDKEGTLAVVIAGDLEDPAALMRIAPSGEAQVVALLDAEQVGAEASALAWDEAHGVVWIVGAFGVVALQPAG